MYCVNSVSEFSDPIEGDIVIEMTFPPCEYVRMNGSWMRAILDEETLQSTAEPKRFEAGISLHSGAPDLPFRSHRMKQLQEMEEENERRAKKMMIIGGMWMVVMIAGLVLQVVT